MLFAVVWAWIIRRIDAWDQKRLLAGKPVRGGMFKNGRRAYMSELERASLGVSDPTARR